MLETSEKPIGGGYGNYLVVVPAVTEDGQPLYTAILVPKGKPFQNSYRSARTPRGWKSTLSESAASFVALVKRISEVSRAFHLSNSRCRDRCRTR